MLAKIVFYTNTHPHTIIKNNSFTLLYIYYKEKKRANLRLACVWTSHIFVWLLTTLPSRRRRVASPLATFLKTKLDQISQKKKMRRDKYRSDFIPDFLCIKKHDRCDFPPWHSTVFHKFLNFTPFRHHPPWWIDDEQLEKNEGAALSYCKESCWTVYFQANLEILLFNKLQEIK